MEEEIKKICTSCNLEKPISQFHKGTSKYGRRSMCAICTKERYDQPERLGKIGDNRKIKRKNDKEYRLKNNESIKSSYRKNILRYLVKVARSRAKKKGIEFNITESHLLLPEFCPLLGIKMKINEGRVGEDSYSIDKINPDKGYTKDNVWIISMKANAIKNNATIEEIELLAKNLRIKLQETNSI